MSAGSRPPSDQNTREQSLTDRQQQSPRTVFAPGDPVPNLEMWTLVRKLGGGGFGEVWLAKHERKGVVAVKFCTDPTARHQLVTHERTVVARVMKHSGHHPNIVPLLECNLTGDIPWLMYEFVEGGTLAEAMDEWRKLPLPLRLGRAVRTLHALTGALGKFHRLNPPLVHRDLKPQNVLMTGRTPRITDFGIGGAAAEGKRLEKPDEGSALGAVPLILQNAASSRYAPPEQSLGSPPSPHDDVFALGVIAYQMILADLNADPGTDVARELMAMRIPADLVLLVARSTALDPLRRPKDAKEWETRLAAIMKKKTAAAKPTSRLLRSGDSEDPTEPLDAISESEITAALVTQTLSVSARGRWYSRPASNPDAEWQFVTKTPAEVRISPGEVYRFSIKSTATDKDVTAIRLFANLVSLRYLNLSFCSNVTDASLASLKDFTSLRQLFLRSCHAITDAGLVHLHGLTNLVTLDLTDCPQVTDAGFASLREALPKCKIPR